MKTIDARGFNIVDDVDLFSSKKDIPSSWNPFPPGQEPQYPQMKVGKAEIYMLDMQNEADRKKMSKVYPGMMTKVMSGSAMMQTRREVLSRPDGSTSLFVYIEYCELDAGEDGKKGDKKGGRK